ncbi:MAG: helix-turn-helix domain-containing protein [Candidatus Omnitrophica bacterium]|nr:helix-turn-helix domain-containing protein [Candidatus Omnitrophota bacterium]
MGKYVGVKEVSEYLGLSRGTIYYYIAKKKIPFYRFNGKPRFILDEIDKVIARKSEGMK